MTEITKCTGENCPLKDSCHRYTSKDNNVQQSYFVNPPFDKRLNTCVMIWNDNAEWLYQSLKNIVKPSN